MGCNHPNLAPSPYNGAKKGWVHSHIEPTMSENCKALSKNSLIRCIKNVVRIPSTSDWKEGNGLMLLFNGLGRGWRELKRGHNSFLLTKVLSLIKCKHNKFKNFCVDMACTWLHMIDLLHIALLA